MFLGSRRKSYVPSEILGKSFENQWESWEILRNPRKSWEVIGRPRKS